MSKRLVLPGLIVLVFAAFMQAQNQEVIRIVDAPKKIKKWYAEGVKLAKTGSPEKAIPIFEKALKRSDAYIDVQLQWASAHYRLKNYSLAELGFEKCLQLEDPFQEKIYYTLALSEYYQEKFEEAKSHFEHFLEIQPANSNFTRNARALIKNCEFAFEAVKNPVPFEAQPLPPTINTEHNEYFPSLTADQQTLVFSRRIRGAEDFYYSFKVNGEWVESRPLSELNTPYNEGAHSLSADGKTLVFTGCNLRDGQGSCDLYIAYKINNRWTRPSNMGKLINTPSWESQPSISANGTVLYFTSNRRGGFGSNDIWVSRLDEDGEWTKPKNLGPPINTRLNEESPFIHADNVSLFFMSDGHPGMGQKDLFYSRMNKWKKWSIPQNLGYPINTIGNEGALHVSLDGNDAYFFTDRKFYQGTKGNPQLDIYQFVPHDGMKPNPVSYLRARVFDKASGKRLEAEAVIRDLSLDLPVARKHADTTDGFLVCLPLGRKYSLQVRKTGYVFHSQMFRMDDAAASTDPIILDVFLTPVSKVSEGLKSDTTAVILENVLFGYNSDSLLVASINELQVLFEFMEDNPEVRIELRGHTDNIGSPEFNLELSQRRANRVKSWLVDKGILSSRIESKGFGESRPIATNNTEEGRQKNRRTEFLILH